jgi:hypothetical protein
MGIVDFILPILVVLIVMLQPNMPGAEFLRIITALVAAAMALGTIRPSIALWRKEQHLSRQSGQRMHRGIVIFCILMPLCAALFTYSALCIATSQLAVSIGILWVTMTALFIGLGLWFHFYPATARRAGLFIRRAIISPS